MFVHTVYIYILIIIQRTIIEDHVVLICCMLPSHVDLVSVDINCTNMRVGGLQQKTAWWYTINTAYIFIEAHTVIRVRCMIWYEMIRLHYVQSHYNSRVSEVSNVAMLHVGWRHADVSIFSAHFQCPFSAFPDLRVTLEEISCRTNKKKSDCWKGDDPTAFCF